MNPLPKTEIALKNLRAYLMSTGWSVMDCANTRIELFRTNSDSEGGYASVAIPRSIDFSDSGRLVNEAARLISDYESIPIEKLADKIVRWDRDIIRSRFFKIVGHEDSLPLGIAADAVAYLREFLGYAAYTQTNPAPFFERTGSISGTFTDHCLFGHTFKGSFGLTVECPLQVVPVLPLEGIEPAVPMERKIIERVAIGLLTLVESISIDSIDPLLGGYLTGFNANMCRKLAGVYEKADGRRVEYDISWSPQIRSVCERAWKPVVFDGRAYEFARIAAGELEKAVKYQDSLVQGRVVALKSEMPPGLDEQAEFEHIITMYWEREKNQLIKIRVPLTPTQYMEACDAHKYGKPIKVLGVPEKAGKFWTLTAPHDFAVMVKS